MFYVTKIKKRKKSISVDKAIKRIEEKERKKEKMFILMIIRKALK